MIATPSPTVCESVSFKGFLSWSRRRSACPAEDDREDHQAQLVDEVVLDQGLRELCAAVDHDVAVLFLA